MSALTPADREHDFELKVRKKDSEGRRLLSGLSVGKSTLLTPDEAAVYFIIPRCDIGIKVSKRESFSTSSGGSEVPDEVQEPPAPLPERISHYPSHAPTNAPRSWKWDVERMILLGHPLRNGELQRNNPSGLIPKVLASHIGVYGNTGYGKTTTSLSIVAQAYRWGVIPTIIVPDKVEDWRALRDLFPEFRIFTAGNPGIAPLRLNRWSPPPG
ncbi:MAG: helicase HerA domain-containing protein, partial [Candidatus Thorarchaeota archaeon]